MNVFTFIIFCIDSHAIEILCNHLDRFLNENNIICEEQIGFRKGCRTSDHILSLETLTGNVFKTSKRLFCCFVDTRKAFDTVKRNALFAKLRKYNVHDTFLQFLQCMFKDIILF